MTDNFDNYEHQVSSHHNSGCLKEAVCIDAYRVYDSCADKDCLEDLPVYFCLCDQELVNNASNVRIRDVEVLFVYLDLEPLAFQKGFYSVDITFFFESRLDLITTPIAPPATVRGLSLFSKKVILYGSEGNVKVFSSDLSVEDIDRQNLPATNLPRATVQVAEPVGLSARLCSGRYHKEPCCRIPESVARRFKSELTTLCGKQGVLITIGIFTIVQIERNVQMMIPAYDFCVPTKECVESSDDPCELFSRIDFPTQEFFPPRETDETI